MNETQGRYTSAEPLDHFKCAKCRRHCYGAWTKHYVVVTGKGVVPQYKHGPYCDDCFNGGITVTVTVKA